MIDPEKLPMRLIIAVSLIVVAVGVVSLIGHFDKTEPAREAQQPVPKKPALNPAPAKAPEPVSEPAPASAPISAPLPVETPPAVETPPPPSVSNVAPVAEKAQGERESPRKVIPKRKIAKEIAGKGRFALQFGVFSSRKNAEKVASMLRKKGMIPVLDTLVVAGPYPDKEAAMKGRREGAIVINRSGKYLLQFGDFVSFDRARNLAEELGKKEIKATLETRVRAGRYRSRKEALNAARKLGIAGIVVRR